MKDTELTSDLHSASGPRDNVSVSDMISEAKDKEKLLKDIDGKCWHKDGRGILRNSVVDFGMNRLRNIGEAVEDNQIIRKYNYNRMIFDPYRAENKVFIGSKFYYRLLLMWNEIFSSKSLVSIVTYYLDVQTPHTFAASQFFRLGSMGTRNYYENMQIPPQGIPGFGTWKRFHNIRMKNLTNPNSPEVPVKMYVGAITGIGSVFLLEFSQGDKFDIGKYYVQSVLPPMNWGTVHIE